MTELRPRRSLVAHPFLLALWPVLFLLSVNTGEADIGDAVPFIGLALGGAAVLLGLAWVALRDLRRAGLVTSVLVLAFLTYGHVANLVEGAGWLLPSWLGLAGALVVLAARTRRAPQLTRGANAVSALLVALSLVSIVGSGQVFASSGSRDAPEVPGGGPELAWNGPGPPRDVYYLIFDRYGSTASLQARFRIDNEPFMRTLERRGFTVIRNARANHLRTAQSLASSMRMDYLLDVAEEEGSNSGNLRPVRTILRNAPVGALFQSAGYRYVHIGSWWDTTAISDIADEVLGYEGDSTDFAQVFTETTLLRALPDNAVVAPSKREQHHDAAIVQLQQLERAPDEGRPTFTFAHILLPHPPYVFASDGRVMSEEQARDLSVSEAFEGQLAYTNDRILELLDRLLDVPPERQPIIILQADEGPHPRGTTGDTSFSWEEATDNQLVGKFGILSAMYFPRDAEVPLGDVHTPVNTFRLIFNALYGGDFDTLRERSYIFHNADHVYDFTDVTDRLEAALDR